MRLALLADAVGTVAGAALGTSAVTAYVESSSGVSAGGRTGLTAVVVAALFLLALFFHPLVRMIGGGFAAGNGVVLYPSVASALILVGVMMMQTVREIRWDDLTDAIPAFLTLAVMPLAVSITDGIAFGLISMALLKAVTGRSRELHVLAYAFAAVFCCGTSSACARVAA
jgi:AGZA family xanthine/uracil permease-like MFS transporter